MKEEIRRVIRSSIDMRSKEKLVLSFINESNLDVLTDDKTILEAFIPMQDKKRETLSRKLVYLKSLRRDIKSLLNVLLQMAMSLVRELKSMRFYRQLHDATEPENVKTRSFKCSPKSC